jgi:alkylated DNA repair dioxygenase AlkB
MKSSLFAFEKSASEQLPLIDADILLYQQTNLGQSYDELLRELVDTTAWRQEKVTLFGKSHLQPRLSAWYSSKELNYSYSGITLESRPWNQLLLKLKSRIEAMVGHHFNSLLLNYYRNHRDAMGMHSDDEIELGKQPVIASLSLGEERTFLLKHKYRRDLDTVKLPLPSGSLLLMKGDTQNYWKHGINREIHPCGPRLNLTFRKIISSPV